MIKVEFNTGKVMNDMNNVVNYSIGFLDGVKSGRNQFLTKLGAGIKEILKEYIDSNARVSPETMHHVYEWYQTGSPAARLFDISYRVVGPGISFNSSFRQSTSVKAGSNVPFYDKARIMELGIPVTIKPVRSEVLVFEDDGKTVFTKNPVTVSNPGGEGVQGGFEKAFDAFFSRYLSQSVLQSSGLTRYLSNPTAFKKNFARGVKSGRSAGLQAGYRWILGAGEVI